MPNGEREAVAVVLIAAGSDVNAKDNSGHCVLASTRNADNQDIVRQLIQAGAVEQEGEAA